MTSSSSLYSTPPNQDVSSTNSTSLYGGADTPIPDSSGNVVVRGDLYVLSGNILTTATTGNIFPANATTINLGLAATAVNIGAGSGTTTINNNLVVDGTGTYAGDITATGGDFGNITVGITTNNTIDTTTSDLLLSATTGEIGLIGVGTLYSDQSSFLLLNAPTTITAFDSATSLTMGETTGTTTIRNDLVVQGTGTFTGDITATGGTFGNVSVGVVNNNTIDNGTGTLLLSSTTGDIGLIGVDTLYTDQSSFLLLNAPTTITAFDSATTLNLGDVTGTTFIRNDVSVGGDLKVNGNDIKSNGGTVAISMNGADVTMADNLYVNGITYTDNLKPIGTYLNVSSPTSKAYIQVGEDLSLTDGYIDFIVNSNQWSLYDDGRTGFPNYILPAADGTANQVLTTDGAGNVSWALPGGGGSTFGNITIAIVDDNTISTTTGNLKLQSATGDLQFAADTGLLYPEGGNAFNRPYFQSTTGNSSGVRVVAPNTGTTSSAALSAVNSSDTANAELISLQSFGSATTDPLRIVTGKYTAGVFGASGKSIAFRDGTTTYATVNPAGPSTTTDLITLGSLNGGTLDPVVDTITANTVYTDTITAKTDSVLIVSQPNSKATISVEESIGNPDGIATVSVNSNVWYFIDDGRTQFPNYIFPSADGTSNQVLRTDGSGNLAWYTPTDTNTTYTYTASSTTGGANLTLTGSDASTNTVKLTNGGHITATYTSATEVTLGSDATDANTASAIVARDASGNFSAGTITAALSGNATTATTAGKVANSLTAGTHLSGGPFDGSAAVTLTTDATDANTASTIVARDANGDFSAGTITANLTNGDRVLGSLTATPSTTYTFPAPALTSITDNDGIDAVSSYATALGNGAQGQFTHYFGDTFAGGNTGAVFSLRTANGNSETTGTLPFTGVAPVAASAVTSANIIGGLNFNGYATSGFSEYIATQNQGGGFNALHAGQIQFAPAETFADGTLTISGATITAVSRVNATQTVTAVAGTRGQLTIPSTLVGVGTAVVVTGTLTGTATGISAGTYYVVANNGGAGNSTQITLSATVGGVPITTTAGTVTGLTFTRQLIIVTYSAQSNIPFSLNSKVAVSGFTNVSTGTFMVVAPPTTTSVTIGATSSGVPALSGSQSVSTPTMTNAGTTFRVRGYPSATTMSTGNRVEFISHSASTATYRADTFAIAGGAYGNTSSSRLTVDSSKITAALPVVFPAYTVAALTLATRTLVGAVGWQVAVSDSPTNAGRMAYWSTTATAGWRYIDDNTAV